MNFQQNERASELSTRFIFPEKKTKRGAFERGVLLGDPILCSHEVQHTYSLAKTENKTLKGRPNYFELFSKFHASLSIFNKFPAEFRD